MDERAGTGGGEVGGVRADPCEHTRTAGYLELERQKDELRRERDEVLLSLGTRLGEDGLAQALGLTPAAAGGLVARAQERLRGGHVAGAEEERIVLRRRGAAGASGAVRDRRHGGRWAGADAYYEALGRTSPRPQR